jgi:group I intron endonuclease
MYGFIYLTTNLVNGKKYIGMCKNTHRENYLGSGTLLKKAIEKYGKENFKREILQECVTFEELSEAEKYWIYKHNAVNDENFYNLTAGGFGGSSDYLKEYWNKLTKEERKKCRNWYINDMTGKNNPMYGKKHSLETRKKIGLKSKDRNWHHPNHNGKLNPRAKRVLVEYDGKHKIYDCLKDVTLDINIPYSTLKSIAQKNHTSKRYKIKISYVEI